MGEKETRFFHFGKPYNFAGLIPQEGIEEVRDLIVELCDGDHTFQSFGTSGSHSMPSSEGSVGLDLSLFALRMENNKKEHEAIRETSMKYNIPWLVHLLLEKMPEDNLFIISADGEVWSIVW